jgi:glycosyltransferase involved in cell wall biosynthesis
MLFKLISAMDRSRFDNSIVSLMDKGLLGPEIERSGVPVYEIKMKKGPPGIAEIWSLRNVMQKVNPNIIQGWMYHGNLAAYGARKMFKGDSPVIWNIRQALYDLRHEKRQSRVVIRIGAKLSNSIAKVIYNSCLSANQHEKFGYAKDRRVLIPNGFDINKFKPIAQSKGRIRSELGIPSNAELVGTVGRFHPMKDHKSFIEAAIILLKRNNNLHFLLAGDGLSPGNRELASLVQSFGSVDRFHFMGRRTDVADIMNALDIFVLSSWAEAFPNVVGEAMACGVACVVTDVGDSAHILDTCGRVVPPRNPVAMADAIQKLHNLSPEQRYKLGVLARERIRTHFSIQKIASMYESLYDEVLTERRVM